MNSMSRPFALGLTALFASCFSTGDSNRTAEVQDGSGTVADHSLATEVVSSGRFQVVSNAMVSAGLAADLAGNGPYTVFVVSDQTLNQLPLTQLNSPEGALQLDAMARYHVVPGRFTAADLGECSTVTTLCGQRLELTNWNGQVELRSSGGADLGLPSARIVEADRECDNGILHVIDQPLVPKFATVGETLENAGLFRQFCAGAQASGLFEQLAGEGPITVFAPSDEAFGQLDRATLTRLTHPANRAELVQLLRQHVVRGRVYGDTLHHQSLQTLAGTTLDVDWIRGRAYIGEVQVVTTDVEASNGVVHVVDRVLGAQ
jgi:transforming growth factor-beta-induced protein